MFLLGLTSYHYYNVSLLRYLHGMYLCVYDPFGLRLALWVQRGRCVT